MPLLQPVGFAFAAAPLTTQPLRWERGRPARNERAARTQFFTPLLMACVAMALQLVFVSPAQAQTPAATPKPSPEPAVVGTIRGRVVTSDGRPMTNATVMAQGVSLTPSIKVKQVDAEGSFVLEDLAAGLYIVMANAPGYIDEILTNADPTDLPRHIIGSRVKITMIKGGVITGTVTDSKGQPVVGVPVNASAPSGASPLASFAGANAGETDDRGIYRLYGLPPGPYTVAAGGGSGFGMMSSTGFELDVPTFYPSSTRDTAVPVAVRSGDEATGIDIKYRGAEGHAVSGVVLGSVEAGGTGAIFVMLSAAGTNAIQAMSLTVNLDQRRTFNFFGVADGEYDLFAGYQGQPTDDQLMGSKRITVRNGDVTGVEIKLSVPGSIKGTIALDPIKEEERCDKRASQVSEVLIKTLREDAKKVDRSILRTMFGNIGTVMSAKGEFNIRNVEPGKYRFGFKLPTDAWYVRAIAANSAAAGPSTPVAAATRPAPAATTPASPSASTTVAGAAQTELSQGVVTIKSTERVAGVTIAIGQDAAGLIGKVAGTNEAAAIPGGLRVHLIPAEREQANNVLRYSEAAVNSDGSFALTNLAPGRYFIVSRIATETAAGPRSDNPAAVRHRELAWNAAPRAKLRTAAEAANIVVELKPCQRLNDYSLKLQPIP